MNATVTVSTNRLHLPWGIRDCDKPIVLGFRFSQLSLKTTTPKPPSKLGRSHLYCGNDFTRLRIPRMSRAPLPFSCAIKTNPLLAHPKAK